MANSQTGISDDLAQLRKSVTTALESAGAALVKTAPIRQESGSGRTEGIASIIAALASCDRILESIDR